MDLQHSRKETEHRRKVRLQLRRSRFQGSHLFSSDSSCNTFSQDDDAIDNCLETPTQQSRDPPVPPFQNISSLRAPRRKRSIAMTSPSSSGKAPDSDGGDEDWENDTPSPQKAVSGHQPSQSNSSKPMNRRHHPMRSRASLKRKSPSSGTTQYIEHLESQLASMQTQLQAITSPTSSRSTSARLRAVNAQNKILQQEVADWEDNFAERLREQDDRHDVALSHLHNRIAMLVHENTQKEQKLRELASELEDRAREVEASESANCDLERRLEFMSNLVATSPGKLDLHMPPPSNQRRKHKSPDPLKRLSTHLKSPSRSSFSAKALPRSHTIDNVVEGSAASAQVQRNATWSEGIPDGSCDLSRDSGYSTELTNDLSDSATLFDNLSDLHASPSRRQSMLSITSVGEQDRPKPVRRMRRFYAGSTRQSLILPSTNAANASDPSSTLEVSSHALPPLSAPVTSAPTFEPIPCLNTGHSALERLAAVSPRPQRNFPVRRRSSTWGEKSASSTSERGDGIRISSDADITPSTNISCSLTSSTSSSQPHSIRRSQGRNLFEELSKLKQERDRSRLTSIDSTVTLTATPATRPQRKQRSITSPQANALSDTSSLTEPAEEPEVDPYYHQLPWAAHSRDDAAETTQPHFLHLPAPLQTLVSVLLHPLSLQLPLDTARHLMTHTWHTLTLSRPVLEFRVWLIRLLLGRLRSKHGAIILIPRTVGSAVSASTSPRAAVGLGLGVAGVRSRRCSVAGCDNYDQEWEDPGIDETPKRPPRHRLVVTSPPKLVWGRDYDGLDVGEDGEVVIAEESDDETPSRETTAQEAQMRQLHRPPPGLGWLKLGATMVAAVGMALVDGPGAVFEQEGCRVRRRA